MSGINLTVVSPTWIDDRGASVPDWNTTTSVEETDWRVQPLSSAEILAMGRQGVTTMLKAHGPHDTALTEHDRAIVDDVTYEVDGAIQRFKSITGHMAHVEVYLKRVEG